MKYPTFEFIVPTATVAVNLPYVIRSRLIFAATHLCHQANKTLDGREWKDDLPLDREIYLATAQERGARWRTFGKLKLSLERIAGSAYRTATLDFRDAYNHRFSPNFVLGISQVVTRIVDRATGSVGCGIGGVGPLELSTVVPLLREQLRRCYAAFERFQALVREHEAAIAKAISDQGS